MTKQRNTAPMSKTMEAIAVYELFNNYAIDDYLNVYRKDTGYLLGRKKHHYLQHEGKFHKYRPEWCLAYVKMLNTQPVRIILDKVEGLKQGLKPTEQTGTTMLPGS